MHQGDEVGGVVKQYVCLCLLSAVSCADPSRATEGGRASVLSIVNGSATNEGGAAGSVQAGGSPSDASDASDLSATAIQAYINEYYYSDADVQHTFYTHFGERVDCIEDRKSLADRGA